MHCYLVLLSVDICYMLAKRMLIIIGYQRRIHMNIKFQLIIAVLYLLILFRPFTMHISVSVASPHKDKMD